MVVEFWVPHSAAFEEELGYHLFACWHRVLVLEELGLLGGASNLLLVSFHYRP